MEQAIRGAEDRIRERPTASYARAFLALFQRDLQVLMKRQIGSFIIRVCMNPMLFLFIFTYVMPHMSHSAQNNPTAGMGGGGGFGTVLLPGLMAVAVMFSGIAAVALPLAQEFGITREIDDRVMCPLPVAAVAIEKILFSAVQSVLAAAFVFPLAYFLPAQRVLVSVHWWLLIVVLVLASIAAGALGLVLGTTVPPQQIGLIFGVVVMPITFLGCVYYPWTNLDTLKWMQMGVLANPIVYMSEGLRAALTPGPHMSSWTIVIMLTFFCGLLTWMGIKGFLRRVIG